MPEENNNEIRKILELQQEIFGDTLYERIDVKKPVQQINETSPQTEDAGLFTPDFNGITSLHELNEKICNCVKCPLGTARNKFVFGEGNPEARVMVIGEGPGADEDMQGRPFVGRAGQLLDKILEAVNFKREEVYIANIVKCRPPGNRVPLPNEISECIPYLHKQIEIIKPAFILCLGSTSIQAILGQKGSLGSFRNKIYDFMGAKVFATYHPAALLRNPGYKRDCWEDVKFFRKNYDEKFGN
ncbi:MAG: uracil-DNA glycosylase [Ignavibacteriaceae bacterium]|nr:uracil-DNA glycosylase [Ignavibacteriaceae bacterium]NUM69235.1 uracil-DNA glycosylase [Ignavibacteriaceae bacterium]